MDEEVLTELRRIRGLAREGFIIVGVILMFGFAHRGRTEP